MGTENYFGKNKKSAFQEISKKVYFKARIAS